MDKPSLSRLERRKNRTTTRLCMICGNYTPFGQCMIYPKGKRREFDEALDLPKFVSDALPSSCSICIKHFENADVVSVRADAHAKVKIDAVPCKGMDGIFLEKLRELDPLEVLAKPDVNPISVVKEKLGLDRHTRYVKPLGRSEEVSEDEDDKVEDDPRSILAYLFTNNEDSEPLQPLPSTTSTKKKGEAPPLLERMDDDDETVDNEPPPLIAANSNSSYSLRPKRTVVVPATVAPPLKKARVSLAPIPSTSNGSDADLIKQLRTQLTEKNTEIHLLKKKLLATEELLAFYMNTTTPEINESESLVAKSEANDKPQQNQALKIGNQRISWKAARPQSPQATAMVVECSQDSLQQHLSGLNRADSTDLDSNSNEVTST